MPVYPKLRRLIGYFREMAALISKGSPDPVAMREVMTRHGLIPAPQP